MEPCRGVHQIAEQIQELGHEVMMISGRHVQAWVKDHCNGQKTDLNDAFAILNLAYDRWLTPIRGRRVRMPSARSAGLLSPIEGATNEDYGARQGYAPCMRIPHSYGPRPLRECIRAPASPSAMKLRHFA